VLDDALYVPYFLASEWNCLTLRIAIASKIEETDIHSKM